MNTGGGLPHFWAERVLEDLRFHWGVAYRFRYDRVWGRWEAGRRDTGRLLIAGSARELRNLIVGDYSGRPVPRGAGPGPGLGGG